MAIRTFDFECSEGHKHEYFVHSDTREVECLICGARAYRVVSTPNLKLDGITGSFPTASDKWARVHKQAAAAANAKYKRHGSL